MLEKASRKGAGHGIEREEYMSKRSLKTLLKSMEACPEALAWVEDRTLDQAWAECQRPDWMFWLCLEKCGTKGWPSKGDAKTFAKEAAKLLQPMIDGCSRLDAVDQVAVNMIREKFAPNIKAASGLPQT